MQPEFDLTYAKNDYVAISLDESKQVTANIEYHEHCVEMVVAFDFDPIKTFAGAYLGLGSCSVSGSCAGCTVRTMSETQDVAWQTQVVEHISEQHSEKEGAAGLGTITEPVSIKLSGKVCRSLQTQSREIRRTKNPIFFEFSHGPKPEWRFKPNPASPLPFLQGRADGIKLVVTLSPTHPEPLCVFTTNVLRFLKVVDKNRREAPPLLSAIAKAVLARHIRQTDIKAR